MLWNEQWSHGLKGYLPVDDVFPLTSIKNR